MFCQRIHPEIRDQIHNLVKIGIDSVTEIKHLLKEFVRAKFDNAYAKPNLIDEGYYPGIKSIRSNIDQSKIQMQYSKIDQENLHSKMME